jgi:hypothetical protein
MISDSQTVPECLKADGCVIADSLNMLYLMETQQFTTGKVLFHTFITGVL